MSELPHLGIPADRAAGAPPVPPPGPIAQSVVIGFRATYVATALLALLWATNNVREIAPDSQAVVLRFGRIVRAQQAGLLIAWPRPIETVRLLPGPDRQLSQDVDVLPTESDKARAVIESGTQPLPANVAAYLTGDGNVVLLNATLFYRIADPVAYALSQTHVDAALNRAFRASSVRVTAGRNLNDFLVVQNASGAAGNDTQAQAITALRSEVRSMMLQSINERLQQLTTQGASLGVEVQRIDMTAWLPPEAKAAFDAVLTATQAADRGVAMARTDAERRRQDAEKESNRLTSAAEATAKEMVAGAHVATATILAIEHEETAQTRNSLLLHAYRDAVADIMNRVGSVTLIDPQSGTRFVLPGKQK
jgi:regulator of protease activity HflC (stomatin/prohibitin superfamily)